LFYNGPDQAATGRGHSYSAGEADKSTIAGAMIKAITIRMAGTLLFRLHSQNIITMSAA
jgi:hypothetical protein